MNYPVEMILSLRRAVELYCGEYGEEFLDGKSIDTCAQDWAGQGWEDPASMIHEWVAIGCLDATAAWEMTQAGIYPQQAATPARIGDSNETVAQLFWRGTITIEEATELAGVESGVLGRLARLGKRRAELRGELEVVGAEIAVVARAAKRDGASVADISRTLGISRHGVYGLFD